MFELIGAKLNNKIDILNFYDNLFTSKTVLYRNTRRNPSLALD